MQNEIPFGLNVLLNTVKFQRGVQRLYVRLAAADGIRHYPLTTDWCFRFPSLVNRQREVIAPPYLLCRLSNRVSKVTHFGIESIHVGNLTLKASCPIRRTLKLDNRYHAERILIPTPVKLLPDVDFLAFPCVGIYDGYHVQHFIPSFRREDRVVHISVECPSERDSGNYLFPCGVFVNEERVPRIERDEFKRRQSVVPWTNIDHHVTESAYLNESGKFLLLVLNVFDLVHLVQHRHAEVLLAVGVIIRFVHVLIATMDIKNRVAPNVTHLEDRHLVCDIVIHLDIDVWANRLLAWKRLVAFLVVE